MTDFQEWWEVRKAKSQGMYDAKSLSEAAFLAGQASAEQRVKWQDDLIQELQAKCAELERERDNIKAIYESHGKNMKQSLDENVKLYGRIAELTRERDEWKHWGSNFEAELAEKRSAWAEHLANAQKERDHYKERTILLRDELKRIANLFDHNNDLDRLLKVKAAAQNLIICGQYSTSAFERLERLVK